MRASINVSVHFVFFVGMVCEHWYKQIWASMMGPFVPKLCVGMGMRVCVCVQVGGG